MSEEQVNNFDVVGSCWKTAGGWKATVNAKNFGNTLQVFHTKLKENRLHYVDGSVFKDMPGPSMLDLVAPWVERESPPEDAAVEPAPSPAEAAPESEPIPRGDQPAFQTMMRVGEVAISEGGLTIFEYFAAHAPFGIMDAINVLDATTGGRGVYAYAQIMDALSTMRLAYASDMVKKIEAAHEQA